MQGDIAILAPSGWLMGGKETDELEEAIRRLIDEGNRRLVLDLSDVAMMNSIALGVVTGCRMSYANRGGQIVLCGLDNRLHHIFVVTKLAMLFDCYAAAKDAIAALQAAGTTQPAE
jgi:anti-anti-sigma factor